MHGFEIHTIKNKFNIFLFTLDVYGYMKSWIRTGFQYT